MKLAFEIIHIKEQDRTDQNSVGIKKGENTTYKIKKILLEELYASRVKI